MKTDELEVVVIPDDTVMTLYNWRGHISIQIQDGNFYLEVGDTIRKVADNFDDWKSFTQQPNILPCISCGLNPIDGRDACAPDIEGALGACCGHGLVKPYVGPPEIEFPSDAIPPKKNDLTLLQHAFSVVVPAGPFGSISMRDANELWAARSLSADALIPWISEKMISWGEYRGVKKIMMFMNFIYLIDGVRDTVNRDSARELGLSILSIIDTENERLHQEKMGRPDTSMGNGNIPVQSR